MTCPTCQTETHGRKCSSSYCKGHADGFYDGREEQAKRFGPYACNVLADKRQDTAETYDEWAKTDTMPRAREAWPLLAAHHRAEAAQLRAWASS